MSKHVLFTGVTGFIGGSVFTSIRSAHPDFTYTALIRSESHAPAVRNAGANPIIGTFADLVLVARLAEEADIIVNCSGTHGIDFQNAMIKGLKKRRESGKGVGVLIHTSGASLFLDGSKEGKLVEGGKVYCDGNVNDIKSESTVLMYGQVDALTLEASDRDGILSYVVAPAAVHGLGSGPVERVSNLHKLVGGLFIAAGQAYTVGEGTNVFGAIHISDLVELYLLVFNHALSNDPPKDTSYERYYFGTHEVISWRTIAEAYGKALHQFGKIPSPEVAKQSFHEAGPLAAVLAGNLFTKAQRGAALGWLPKGPSLVETMQGDLEELYSKQGSSN